ncbi:hypothetical protein ES703_21642 [subsurface metagenome]
MTRQKKRKRQNEISKNLAWLFLLGLARHKDINWNVKGRKFDLQRGQFYCCKSDLAKRWGWPRLKVQRFFKKLETQGKINQELFDGVGTIIEIIDFDNAMGEFFA